MHSIIKLHEHGGICEVLEDLRKQVLEAARLAEKLDLCRSGGGNFSMRDRNSDLVAITPHDTARSLMSLRDMLVV